jgi:hypothetical protein
MLRRLNTRLLSSLSVGFVTPEVRSIVEDLPEGRGSMHFPLTARGHAMAGWSTTNQSAIWPSGWLVAYVMRPAVGWLLHIRPDWLVGCSYGRSWHSKRYFYDVSELLWPLQQLDSLLSIFCVHFDSYPYLPYSLNATITLCCQQSYSQGPPYRALHQIQRLSLTSMLLQGCGVICTVSARL